MQAEGEQRACRAHPCLPSTGWQRDGCNTSVPRQVLCPAQSGEGAGRQKRLIGISWQDVFAGQVGKPTSHSHLLTYAFHQGKQRWCKRKVFGSMLELLTLGISTQPGDRFNSFVFISLCKACHYIQFLFHTDKMHHIYSAQEKKALMLKDWQIEWMHLQQCQHLEALLF